jgi:glycosyltransferase involved in cell wall biosynthesis
MPDISLIMPTLNQAATLAEALDSVAAQDFAPRELIVMDAMSTDETPRILERYRSLPFLRVIREPDRGQSDGIDKGIRHATGDIVGWLNSDDMLLPGALRAVSDAFEANPAAPLIYGGGSKLDWKGNVTKRVPAAPYRRDLLGKAFYFLQPAMFFRRQAYLDVGGLDRDLAYAMDWDLALKLANLGDFASINRELASLRCYDGTKSQTGGWQRAREIASIGRRHHGLRDRNYMIFALKTLFAPLPSRWVRRGIEHLVHLIWHSPGPMVEGWPPPRHASNSHHLS